MYDKLTALGAENCFPKFIGSVGGVRSVLAEVKDGALYLTEQGKAFIAEREGAAPAKPKAEAKPKAPKPGKQAPAAEVIADDPEVDGDLDLD